MNLISLFAFTVLIKNDSIVFSIKSKDKEAALSVIRKVYITENSEKVFERIEGSIHNEEGETPSLRECMFDPRYKKATWTVFAMTVFN